MASRIAAAGGMTSVVIRSGVSKGRRHARFMVGLLIVGLASMHSIGASGTHSLTLEERVAAQRAIEQVYWNHRIWPKENPGPKPALSAVLPDDALRAKVEDTLRKSNALEQYWRRPITAEQLQAEMNRMAAHTRNPQVLKELFATLGNDPFLIAETLARQILADRLIHDWYSNDERFHGDLKKKAEAALAACPDVACMKSLGADYRETSWRLRGEEVGTSPSDARRDVVTLQTEEWKAHLVRLATALGGVPDSLPLRKVGVLEVTPDAFVVTAVLSQGKQEVRTAAAAWRKVSFDDWWATERPTLPTGIQESANLLTLPTTPSSECAADTWEPTGLPSSTPMARSSHMAVWTGAEMIVWGGVYNTGGRYDPSTDAWTPTSTANTPIPVGGERTGQTAVWTGTEMIVWGGGQDNVYCDCSDIDCTCGEPIPYPYPGGRYDPLTDAWTVVGGDILSSRYFHSATWTGTEMIVWGGVHVICTHLDGCYECEDSCEEFPLVTGGRYNPSTHTWTPTSTGANVPDVRIFHTAVWTGTEMIVWGGLWQGNQNTGGRYDPSTDTWTPTSTGANVPDARNRHTAVWTGTEMIVWGGEHSVGVNTGGRYEPSTDTWMPTSTGANVPTARYDHTTVWTGTGMIVWGGYNYGSDPTGSLNTGGRYDPSFDKWVPTSTGPSVPSERLGHTAVWTGTQMIVWGGKTGGGNLNDGGLYCPCPKYTLYYRDADGDSYGDAAVAGTSCDGTIPAGNVANRSDCNDASASVRPGAAELCNGADDDCDGTADNVQGDCSLFLTSPLDGDVLDCRPGTAPPTIRWNVAQYDRFRISVSWSPAFGSAQTVTSGSGPRGGGDRRPWLNASSWTVPGRKWTKVCKHAGANLYLRVLGLDKEASKTDPLRKFASPTVVVAPQR
jgi:hypothetical protein